MVILLYLFWFIFATIELFIYLVDVLFTKQRNEACDMVETEIIPLESIDISFNLLMLWKLMSINVLQNNV